MHFLDRAVRALGRGLRAYSDWLASITWKRFFLIWGLAIAALHVFIDLPVFRDHSPRPAHGVRYKVHIDRDGTVDIRPIAAGAAGAAMQADITGDLPDNRARISIGADGLRIEARDGRDHTRVRIDGKGVSVDDKDDGKNDESRHDDGKHDDGNHDSDDDRAVVLPPVPPAARLDPTQPGKSPSAVGGTTAITPINLLALDDDKADEVRAALGDVTERLDKLAADGRGQRSNSALRETLGGLPIVFGLLSILLKVEAGRRQRVEVKAAAAMELAGDEQLKRQLAEARMQTMQAQVEPHFLFNTLAAIDHLIETDPARASAMQKHLIQYLRGALPSMRERATNLGREADQITSYLEILKVRMEDRLAIRIDVPAGLRSASFPPLMLQTLVENAIKHGLEPAPAGGSLAVTAEIVDGALRVAVADTGVGFDPANVRTRGTGLGLANIRERLALQYGDRARLVISANAPSGTVVAIELPYELPGKTG